MVLMGADTEGDRDVGVEPIAETTESVGLVLVAPDPSVLGCYRMARPLHASRVTGEARVLVVESWDDPRVRRFAPPPSLPPGAGLILHGTVEGVSVSPQFVALVRRAWGPDLLWAALEHRGVRYVGAWRVRYAGVGGWRREVRPVAALAPLAPVERYAGGEERVEA